jgi:hypothetical protein
MEKCHGVRRYPFLTAFEAKAFRGGRFHADRFGVYPHGVGQVHAHLVAIRGKAGRLGCNHGIDIAYLKATFSHQGSDLCQKPQGISARIAEVGIGEELADIARTDGAEQGIGNSMGQDVGIGMSEQALFMGNLDPA